VEDGNRGTGGKRMMTGDMRAVGTGEDEEGSTGGEQEKNGLHSERLGVSEGKGQGLSTEILYDARTGK
jgi:hypothetical protein